MFKKRFGLKEALKVLEKKPDIYESEAKVGIAFLEALGIPNVASKEASQRIEELERHQRQLKQAVKLGEARINSIASSVAEKISAVAKKGAKLVDQLDKKLSALADKITQKAQRKVVRLQAEISRVLNQRLVKIDIAQDLVNRAKKEIADRVEKETIRIRKQASQEIKRIKEDIKELQKKVEKQEKEVSTLEEVVRLFK